MRTSLITLLISALSLPLSVARAEAPHARVEGPDAGRSKLGGYVETDLGVLMLLGPRPDQTSARPEPYGTLGLGYAFD